MLTRTSPSTGLLLILVMASPLCTVVPSEVSTQLCVSVPRGTESTRTMGVATPTPQMPVEKEPTYITTAQDVHVGKRMDVQCEWREANDKIDVHVLLQTIVEPLYNGTNILSIIVGCP